MRVGAWVGLLLGAATSLAAQESSPGDVLFRMRDAYARLESYRDEGEITMEDRGAGGGVVRLNFKTRLDAGVLTMTVEPQSGAVAPTSVALDRRRIAGEPALAPLRGRLDEIVGSGAGAALWVPALLVAGPLAVPDPQMLALDGEEACGDATCYVLAGADPESDATLRIWVGKTDFLVHRSEIELHRGEVSRVFRVTLRPLPPSTEIAGEVYSESIDVSLVSVVVRVVDRRGRVIEGLKPEDFRVHLGKDEIAVEAAEWVGGSKADAAVAADVASKAESVADLDALPPPAPGRLIVFYVQASFERSRLSGQMRMRGYVQRFLDDMRPDDRVAVVSFDSHAKLRCDFTLDRKLLQDALDAGMRLGREPLLRAGGDPSLARNFDREAAQRASTPERGLEVTAKALIPIPGEKVVVFLGWGLGRYTSDGVMLGQDYADAQMALDAARATVFALDVTDADYHSLEVGMEQVAWDTGGTYEKTYHFSQMAIDNLEKAIAGHYVLYFRRPDDTASAQRVRVDLRDKSVGEILAPEALYR